MKWLVPMRPFFSFSDFLLGVIIAWSGEPGTCGPSPLVYNPFLPQLGHGDTLKKTRPVQIAALADKSIVSVVCGQYHSLALDDDHK